MKNGNCPLVLMFGAFLVGLNTFCSVALCESKDLSEEVSIALSWLPTDTETLIVTQGPYPKKPTPESGPENNYAMLSYWPFSIIAEIEDGDLFDKIDMGHVVCAVEGARKFKKNEGVGLNPYEGAQIIFFKKDGPNIVDMLQGMEKDRYTKKKISSVDVFIFGLQRRVGQKVETRDVFLCAPRSNILLATMHKGYLVEILQRIGSKEKSRAFPEDLPEWGHVNPEAKAWAIRHYNPKTGASDPTSPYANKKEVLGEFPSDESAIGIVICEKPSKEIRVTYLSKNKDVKKIGSEIWLHEQIGVTPKVEPAGKDSVRIIYAKDKFANEPIGEIVFRMLFVLGHAIAL